MFHFPRYAPYIHRVTADDSGVSPFGHFRIKGYLAPPRNLSQPYHVLHRFLKPRHPPYTLCSCKEHCTPLKMLCSLHSHCAPLHIILSVVRRYILRTYVTSFLQLVTFVFVCRGRKDLSGCNTKLNSLPDTRYLCSIHLGLRPDVSNAACRASIPYRTLRQDSYQVLSRICSCQIPRTSLSGEEKSRDSSRHVKSTSDLPCYDAAFFSKLINT